MLAALCLFLVQSEARAPRDLTETLVPLLEESGLPALGAAVVTAGGLEALGAAGLRSWTGDVDVTSDDRWHLGSCTKAMTATLVARLVERGTLGWETTVGSVFPEGLDAGWRDVTVLWLLCHRSGASLNFEQELWERMVARGGTLREQRRFFVAEGLAHPPATPPNTSTSYSNAAFVVAAAMLEELTDTPYEELMAREVFAPLGMTKSGFGAPGTAGKLDQPLGHVRGGERWTPVALGPGDDNPAAGNPAGGAHATLGDWARFIAAHLRRDESFLSAASWTRLHTSGGSDWGQSPGWVVTEADWADGPLLRHLGSNGFWVAEASLAPSRDLAILLVTNVGDDAAEKPFQALLAALRAPQATAK